MGGLITAAFSVIAVAWRTSPRAVLITLGEVLSTVLRFIQPLAVGLVISGVIAHRMEETAWGTALLVSSLGFGGALEALAVGYRVRLIEDIGFAFDREIMQSLLQIGHLDRLEEPKLANAIAKAKGRADMMGYCFNSLIAVLLQAAAPLTSACVAAVIDPRLLLLTLAGLPMVLVVKHVSALHSEADDAAQGYASRAAAWAELFSDPDARAERKVFRLWDWYRLKTSDAVSRRERAYFRAVDIDSVASLLAELFYLACTGAVLLWIFTTDHHESAGVVVAALLVSLDLKGTLDALRFALSGLGPALRGSGRQGCCHGSSIDRGS